MRHHQAHIPAAVRDYSVSKETFELIIDPEYGFLKTVPKPNKDDLNRYYDSDDYISHTDSQRNWFEKIYQWVKKRAIQNKVKLINSGRSRGGKLLDIGAGTGDFLVEAKRQGWDIVGFEPHQKAQQFWKEKQLTAVGNLDDIEAASLDVVTMWHVLEHVYDLEEQLTTLARILKKDGVLIVAVPNCESFDAKHYGAYWAAYDVPRHLWHFSQTAMEKLMTAFDFQIVKKHPMYFDSFYVSLLSEKYQTGKMNFVKAFYIGLKSNWKAKKNFQYSSIIYEIKKK
ncbi:class I SAM-dependent methyltransferase [Flavobacterium sp. JP2137]|uniref:class I SAM-dependent methyltransferase n=1 Tax=Flavobacterium sp. JP2137 TaxID=3414510 RepID=UPI003D2FFE32